MARGLRGLRNRLFGRGNSSRSSSTSRDNEEDEETTRVPVPNLGSDESMNEEADDDTNEDSMNEEEAEAADLANHAPQSTRLVIWTWQGVYVGPNLFQ